MGEDMTRPPQILREPAGQARFTQQGFGALRARFVLQQTEHVQAAQHAFIPPSHQHAALPCQQAYGYVHPLGRALFFVHRQKCRVALARRIAKPAPWAVVTVGFARVAQRGAQLHQSLIVIAGMSAGISAATRSRMRR